jgi:serine protease Do
VNIRGEVIGVNTAIASQSGTSEGYGFAVPIDLASQVADDLIRYGRWRRAILGVSIDEVTVEDYEAFRLPYVGGALVQDFGPSSLAQRAGLRRGDVIIGVDGEEVTHVNELQRLIAKRRPGEEVALDIVRMGEKLRIETQLVESETAPVIAAVEPAAVREGALENRIGARVVELSAEAARRYGYERAGGVVIDDVSRYGPLGERFQATDFRIVSIDGTPITSLEQFQRVIRGKPSRSVVSLELENAQAVRRIVNIRLRD